MTKNNNKMVYIAALVLFCGGLGFLLFSGISQGSQYFVNVSEALAIAPEKLGNARMFGTVASTDIEGGPGTAGVSFRLLDKDDTAQSILVKYTGAVPDTFAPGAELIVEGGLVQEKGYFAATTLMTKCPSKYKAQREEEKQQQS